MSRVDSGLLIDDEAFNNDYMNSLSPVRKQIVTDVLVSLGYPTITLFITQVQINRLIDIAVSKCSSKACQSFLALMNTGSGCIDVSKYNMEAVKCIYEADISNINTNTGDNLVADPNNDNNSGCTNPLSGCDICNKLCRYRMFSYNGMVENSGTSRLYDYLSYQYAQSELNNLILTDYYLDTAEQKLYVDNYSGYITVEYVKSSCTIEDLDKNNYWKSWIRDYTLARTKMIEGLIRRKYKPTSGVYDLDGDDLVSEGTNEAQELEEKLNDNMGYWNIMRG